MSGNLNKCLTKLKFISSVKSESLRKKLLESMSDECLFKALNEIAINYSKGNIKLNPHQKRKMRKYEPIIRRLSRKNNKNSIKKRLIKQSGGFLPIILPAIASILTSLIT